MRNHLEAFLRHLRDRRSPRTVATYGAVLSAFAERRGGDEDVPTATEVEAFLSRPLQDGGRRSPATRNQELAALRAFAKFAVRELGWTRNPTEGIPLARENTRDPVVLGVAEIQRLFAAASAEPDPWRRARGLGLLVLLSQLGLRVHELVALNLVQLDFVTNTLLAVRGKGGTVHDLPLNSAVVRLVTAWLAEREKRGPTDQEALFVSSTGTRLGVRSVQRFVTKLKRVTNTAKKISPHSFRHSVATLALSLGTDLATVGEILRHADLNTTRLYLGLVDARRREAIGKLAVAIPQGLLKEPSAEAARPEKTEKTVLDVQANLGDLVGPKERSPRVPNDSADRVPARPSGGRVRASRSREACRRGG